MHDKLDKSFNSTINKLMRTRDRYKPSLETTGGLFSFVDSLRTAAGRLVSRVESRDSIKDTDNENKNIDVSQLLETAQPSLPFLRFTLISVTHLSSKSGPMSRI